MIQTALTDEVWTTAAADESATAAREETSEEGEDHDYPQTKQALCERAEAHAADVAAEHFPELPVEAIAWETSTRMQRSAGKAISDQRTEKITIRLSWDAYEAYGWEQFARIVRHELIHAWQYHEHGEADHGPTFRRWVESLETDRHCDGTRSPNTGLCVRSVRVVIPAIAGRRL